MADLLYGTCVCPQILGYQGETALVCNKTAQVYQDAIGCYHSVCPDQHTQFFGDSFATPFVTKVGS